MPLAWTAVALLLLSLVVREGLGQWRELSQWRELAASATAMHSGAEVTLERLQQSAAAQQLVLSDVQPVDAGDSLNQVVSLERLVDVETVPAAGMELECRFAVLGDGDPREATDFFERLAAQKKAEEKQAALG